MFKTFISGIVLGIVAVGATLYFVPTVDQFREQSMIVVQPNQGNTEVFHVNVPMDRILVGVPGQENPVPAGLEWPEDALLAQTRAEMFKIRNGKDAVVGVASRIAASNDDSGDVIEWVLHLPARGSAYVLMQPLAAEDGYRAGTMVAGTREFASLHGPVTERWIANTNGGEGTSAGRIEFSTALFAREVEEE